MVRVPYSHTAAMLVKHSGVDEQIITERLNSLLGGGEFPTEPLSQPEAGDVPEDRAVHDVQSFVDAIKHGVAWMLEVRTECSGRTRLINQLNGVMNVCVGPKAYSVKIRVFNDDLSRSTRLVYFSFDQTFTGQSAGGHKTTWYASKEAAYDAAVTFARAHQDSGITLGNLTTRWQIERSDMDKPMHYSRVDAAIPGMNLMQCGQSDPYLFVQAYKRYNFVGPVTLDVGARRPGAECHGGRPAEIPVPGTRGILGHAAQRAEALARRSRRRDGLSGQGRPPYTPSSLACGWAMVHASQQPSETSMSLRLSVFCRNAPRLSNKFCRTREASSTQPLSLTFTHHVHLYHSQK